MSEHTDRNRNRPNLITADNPDDLDAKVTSGGESLVVSDSPDDGTITRPQVAPPSKRAVPGKEPKVRP